MYKAAELGGMPMHVLRVYMSMVEQLKAHNSIDGCVGKAHTMSCGIPQGCPLSMMLVALHMRPWLIKMDDLQVTANILADDVILVAKGKDMLNTFPKALGITTSTSMIWVPRSPLQRASTSQAQKWVETGWQKPRGSRSIPISKWLKG